MFLHAHTLSLQHPVTHVPLAFESPLPADLAEFIARLDRDKADGTRMHDIRPRRFKLVVFDWDGTLSDSTAIIAQAIQSACRDLGEPVPDDARRAT